MIVKNLRHEHIILVCTEKDCRKNGCDKVCKRLREELEARGLKGTVRIQRCKCLGACKNGPNLLAFPGGKLFSGVKPKKVAKLIEILTA